MLVFAIGHPFGLVGALATGIVHAVGPAPSQWIPNAVAGRLPWLMLDMEVAPGNSGGPVLDAHGEVVGITTMIAFGLTLAVPGEAAFPLGLTPAHSSVVRNALPPDRCCACSGGETEIRYL